MNSIKNEISQRMILDKKEIEEMLKNELNFGSPINNENKQEEKKQEIKDKGNIWKYISDIYWCNELFLNWYDNKSVNIF